MSQSIASWVVNESSSQAEHIRTCLINEAYLCYYWALKIVFELDPQINNGIKFEDD